MEESSGCDRILVAQEPVTEAQAQELAGRTEGVDREEARYPGAPIEVEVERAMAIVVVGDTPIAASILYHLENAPEEYGLTLLVPTHSNPSVSPVVTVVKTTYDLPRLEPHFSNTDLVILTCSSGDFELQSVIFNIALKAGVRKFIPCPCEWDVARYCIMERVDGGIGRWNMYQMLNSLIEDSKAGKLYPPMEFISLVTGVTLDKRLLTNRLGFDIKWHSASVHGSPRARFPVSSTSHIGKLIPAVIQRWSDLRNTIVYAPSCTTSSGEIINAFQNEMLVTWGVGNTTTDDCIGEAKKRIEKGWPDAGMFLMERSVLYDTNLDAWSVFDGYMNLLEVLGIEGETTVTIVKSVLEEFRRTDGTAGCGCG